MNFADIQALDHRLRTRVAGERSSLVAFLRDLDVFDREQAYAELNCRSTFDYLVGRLHFCEGTAWARVNATNVVRRFPRLEAALVDGRLNPTQLIVLRPVITDENVDDLVRRAAHLSKRRTEELAVSIQPRAVPAPGLRKLPTPAPRPAPRGKPRSRLEPVAAERWQWRHVLEAKRKEKLDRLRGYLAHKIPDGDLDKVFDQMLDDALEKHGKRLGYVEPEWPRSVKEKPATPGKRAPVPLAVRRAVLKRDGYRCTSVSPDGERCPATEQLEMDHL